MSPFNAAFPKCILAVILSCRLHGLTWVFVLFLSKLIHTICLCHCSSKIKEMKDQF